MGSNQFSNIHTIVPIARAFGELPQLDFYKTPLRSSYMVPLACVRVGVPCSIIQNTPTHGHTTQTNKLKPRLTDGLRHPIPLLLLHSLPLSSLQCHLGGHLSLSLSCYCSIPPSIRVSFLLGPPSLSASLISLLFYTVPHPFTFLFIILSLKSIFLLSATFMLIKRSSFHLPPVHHLFIFFSVFSIF